MPPPRLALFLNPWGASSFSRHLPTLLAEARKHGYDGVEMSLSDLGADPAARRATSDMIADHGMRLILGLDLPKHPCLVLQQLNLVQSENNPDNRY